MNALELNIPSVIVPLIATVGINNKVTFLEKTGTGYVVELLTNNLVMFIIIDSRTLLEDMNLILVWSTTSMLHGVRCTPRPMCFVQPA